MSQAQSSRKGIALSVLTIAVAVAVGVSVTLGMARKSGASQRVLLSGGSAPVYDGEQLIVRARLVGQVRVVAYDLEGRERWRSGPVGENPQFALQDKTLVVTDGQKVLLIDPATGMTTATAPLGQGARAACTTSAAEVKLTLDDGTTRIVSADGMKTGDAACAAPKHAVQIADDAHLSLDGRSIVLK